MELTLDCQTRTPDSKPRAMRRQGQLPGTLYGHDGANSVALSMDLTTVETMLRKNKGSNLELQLNVTDMPWNGKVLVKEIQTHPWKGSLYHISFFAEQA